MICHVDPEPSDQHIRLFSPNRIHNSLKRGDISRNSDAVRAVITGNSDAGDEIFEDFRGRQADSRHSARPRLFLGHKPTVIGTNEGLGHGKSTAGICGRQFPAGVSDDRRELDATMLETAHHGQLHGCAERLREFGLMDACIVRPVEFLCGCVNSLSSSQAIIKREPTDERPRGWVCQRPQDHIHLSDCVPECLITVDELFAHGGPLRSLTTKHHNDVWSSGRHLDRRGRIENTAIPIEYNKASLGKMFPVQSQCICQVGNAARVSAGVTPDAGGILAQRLLSVGREQTQLAWS